MSKRIQTLVTHPLRQAAGRLTACRFLPRKVKRFRADKNGATAVEFALVALPFFALLYGVMQVTLLYIAQETLDSGMHEAARMIRTGQAQSGGLTEAGMRTIICANVAMIANCDNELVLDVRSFPDFGSVSVPAALDSTGEINSGTAFETGSGGEVVIVRAFYAYKMPIGDSLSGLSNMSGGRRLIATTAAFRNEPF